VSYNPRPKICEGCPANPTSKSFVRPTGPKDAKIVFLGQGPDQDAALDGTPFTGVVGKKFDYWLAASGIRRSECGVGNVVQCWLPAPTKATKEEIEFCKERHWGPWLDGFSDRRIVVFVGTPHSGGSAGDVQRDEERSHFTLGILHPSAVMRGQWSEEPHQIEYLKQAKAIADGLDPILDPEAHLQGDSITTPSLADLYNWEARLSGEGVAVDIETAGDHIRLVGLCDLAPPHHYLGFPVRDVGGKQWWGADFRAAVEWLWRFLANDKIGKVFHNGQAFDIPMLERNGFVVGGLVFDTMLGMHIAATGVPKGLETLAKVHLGWPGWKDMVKGELEGEGK
jgi:uracil-DNA glycosylase